MQNGFGGGGEGGSEVTERGNSGEGGRTLTGTHTAHLRERSLLVDAERTPGIPVPPSAQSNTWPARGREGGREWGCVRRSWPAAVAAQPGPAVLCRSGEPADLHVLGAQPRSRQEAARVVSRPERREPPGRLGPAPRSPPPRTSARRSAPLGSPRGACLGLSQEAGFRPSRFLGGPT